jgi:hypothetical protein
MVSQRLAEQEDYVAELFSETERDKLKEAAQVFEQEINA